MKKLLFPFFLLITFLVNGQILDTMAVQLEVDSLIQLTRKLKKERKYEEALQEIETADKKCLNTFGELSPLYGRVTMNKAVILYSQRKYPEAESLFLKAKDIQEATIGKLHADYAKTLHSLALLYYRIGEYKKAEPLNLEAKEIRGKVLGTDDLNYYRTLINMGAMYNKMGQLRKAELAYLEGKAIFEERRKETDHPLYTYSLNNLANLYTKSGHYEKAEPLLLKAVRAREHTLGKDHPDYASSLNNLAHLYNSIGDPEKAMPLFVTAKDIWGKSLGKTHTRYAESIFNLACLYAEMCEYEKAERLHLEAMDIRANAVGKQHPKYASSLFNLASMYVNMGEYEKAEPLYLESQQIRAKVFGTDHSKYARSLHFLANLYLHIGEYAKAEPLYLEAKAIWSKVFGKNHPHYGMSLNGLANLYAATQQNDKARNSYEEVYTNYAVQLQKYYPSLSEQARIKYLATLQEDINHMIFFANRHHTVSTTVQNMNLLIKGLALEGSTDARIGILTTNDSLLTSQYHDWMAIRRNIADAYTLSLEEKTAAAIDLKQLQEEADQLERELSRASTFIASQLQKKQGKQISYTDLQHTLGENEASVDIVQYQYVEDYTLTDSILYAALISRPSFSKPQFVFLSNEKQLQKLLKASVRQGGSNYIENPQINHQLYKLIWSPLMPFLEGVTKIHLSPSGLLYRVAFGALQTNVQNDIRVMDQFEMAYYGNLRDFILKKQSTKPKQEITLVGGARYDLDSLGMAELFNDHPKGKETKTTDEILVMASVSGITRSIANDSTRNAIRFNYLPGTRQEVETIKTLFQEKQWNTNTLLQENALEDKIKMLSGANAPGLLHIATHGYFFSPYQGNGQNKNSTLRDRIKYADNPLLRSGLVFTGVNHTWEGGRQVPGMDDGVLTAYEISNMDLLDTKLVVLSACETGLGDIHNGEGVFGLQRAFKLAGVNNMIISLWKVSDRETSELMKLFYQNYLNGHAPRQALRKAQLKMSKKYSAYYWAGFILLE